jgi:hypothetical protein
MVELSLYVEEKLKPPWPTRSPLERSGSSFACSSIAFEMYSTKN